MKKRKYTVEQIIGILREAQGGNGVSEAARRHNVSANTIYKWRRTYGGMEVAEAWRLKQLEEENARLKRVVADLAVKVQILQEVNAKKW
jgi:putative transposase